MGAFTTVIERTAVIQGSYCYCIYIEELSELCYRAEKSVS